jgi:hypothetical protein
MIQDVELCSSTRPEAAKNFRLVETTQVQYGDKSVECYRYEDDNGRRVVFHIDPAEPFMWLILDSETKLAVSVIDAFVGTWPAGARPIERWPSATGV